MAMHLSDLKRKPVPELMDMAREMGLDNVGRSRKQEVIAAIVRKQSKSGEDIYGEGTPEILQDGFEFLRSPDSSYLAGPDDIYVSQARFAALICVLVTASLARFAHPRTANVTLHCLKLMRSTSARPITKPTKFCSKNLTPLFPNDRLQLERGNGSTEDLTARIIDLVAPVGKGQRALIVSPPKAGKTLVMQNIAQSIAANNPETIDCFVD